METEEKILSVLDGTTIERLSFENLRQAKRIEELESLIDRTLLASIPIERSGATLSDRSVYAKELEQEIKELDELILAWHFYREFESDLSEWEQSVFDKCKVRENKDENL